MSEHEPRGWTDVKGILGNDWPSRDRVSGTPVLSPEELESRTASRTYDDAMVFESSGTSGRPKRIGYGYSRLEAQYDHEARAFEVAGLDPDDVVLSLAAPIPAISGWAIRSGSRRLGAEVLNRSFDDYEQVLDWREATEVTAVFGTPLVVKSIGEDVHETCGRPPSEVFDQPRIGILFGDHLPEYLRADLEDQWGFDHLRSLYGTVEVGAVAIAPNDSSRLVPILDKLVLEIRPEKEDGTYADEPVDVREVETKTTGSLLITDPDRTKVDITRYEIGDAVRVHPGGDVPRIEVLGRIDNTINLGGAMLYERQIQKALTDLCSTAIDDWKVVVSRPNAKPAVTVRVAGDVSIDGEEFRRQLFERSPPVGEAYEDVGIIEYIRVEVADSSDELQSGLSPDEFDRDVKANRVIRHDSFTE